MEAAPAAAGISAFHSRPSPPQAWLNQPPKRYFVLLCRLSPGSWSAALHDGQQLPAGRHARLLCLTGPAAAKLSERCISLPPPHSGTRTTGAPGQRTIAEIAPGAEPAEAEPLFRLPHPPGGLSRRPWGSGTGAEAAIPHETLPGFERLPESPAGSVRQARRNYCGGPPSPASILRPRPRPVSFPSRPPALHTRATHRCPVPARAAPCGPASRSASTADDPNTRTPPAPCSREQPSTGAHATAPLPHSPLQPRRFLKPCSTPPAASRPPHPPAPAPPPRALQCVPPSVLRSLPTRSGIPGSSPGSHSDPQIRSSRPHAISPGPRSDTSAHPIPPRTDLPQTAPPSAPAGSGTPSRLPLPQYIALLSRPPAPVPCSRPGCKFACSQSNALCARPTTLLVSSAPRWST